jgi:hypothetical protein
LLVTFAIASRVFFVFARFLVIEAVARFEHLGFNRSDRFIGLAIQELFDVRVKLLVDVGFDLVDAGARHWPMNNKGRLSFGMVRHFRVG